MRAVLYPRVCPAHCHLSCLPAFDCPSRFPPGFGVREVAAGLVRETTSTIVCQQSLRLGTNLGSLMTILPRPVLPLVFCTEGILSQQCDWTPSPHPRVLCCQRSVASPSGSASFFWIVAGLYYVTLLPGRHISHHPTLTDQSLPSEAQEEVGDTQLIQLQSGVWPAFGGLCLGMCDRRGMDVGRESCAGCLRAATDP
jgi:hypothetical protein